MTSRTYRSLKDLASDTFIRLFQRIVLFIRPRGLVTSLPVGAAERFLVPIEMLNVTFASYEGKRIPGRAPRLARSYWLQMFDSQGHLYFGGAHKRGCRNCRFLDRESQKPEDCDPDYKNVPERLTMLLQDLQIEEMPAIDAATILPEPVVRISEAMDLDINNRAMAAHIRRMWLRDDIHKDTDNNEEEGLMLDFSDLGVSETIILPEKVGKSGRFEYSLDLSSPGSMREGLGEELFQEISKSVQKAYRMAGLIPLDLVHKDQQRQLRDHTYWDLTRYYQETERQAQTASVPEGEDEERIRDGYRGFLVISYMKRDTLKFESPTAVFDFNQNHFRTLHNKVLKQRADARREERRRAYEASAEPKEEPQVMEPEAEPVQAEPESE